MGEYHQIGEPIDQDNWPAFFELKIQDHLPRIEPKRFGLPANTPTIDPHEYFITSGDALAKAIKLEKNVLELIETLLIRYTKTITVKGKNKLTYKKGFRKYIDAMLQYSSSCHEMSNGLCEAKGPNCFLETEWREQHLIVIPKNPRSKSKDDQQR